MPQVFVKRRRASWLVGCSSVAPCWDKLQSHFRLPLSTNIFQAALKISKPQSDTLMKTQHFPIHSTLRLSKSPAPCSDASQCSKCLHLANSAPRVCPCACLHSHTRVALSQAFVHGRLFNVWTEKAQPGILRERDGSPTASTSSRRASINSEPAHVRRFRQKAAR